MSPFRTAELRAAVLAAWAASPARFREDANAEELLATSYASRVIAELAANGADAARAAGIRGEIDIRLVTTGGRVELRVANTGAPLDRDGVAALAALRASAKRDSDTVGRFGVGFTAVRALTDEPMIVSTTGAVRFSAELTARAVTRLAADLAADPAPDNAVKGGELAAELDRRHGVLPILRLPWPVTGERPLAGYVTEVRLPLRQDLDPPALTIDLAADLLWALPDLAAVTVPGYRVAREDLPDGLVRLTVDDSENLTLVPQANSLTCQHPRSTSWPESVAKTSVSFSPDPHRTVTREGVLPAGLTKDLPIEQRSRQDWRITWVAGAAAPTRVGAPTPTGERIAIPARLIATLPVDEARGTVAAGPVTDHLIAAAADAYVDLVRAHPAAARIGLIPEAAFPLGDFDAALREAIDDRLRAATLFTDAAGTPIRPADMILIPGIVGPAAAAVAEALPGLADWPERADEVARLRSLGARIDSVPAASAALAGIHRPAEFWTPIYDALADQPGDDLADLPIPRRGGGMLIGPRGVLLQGSGDWFDRAARFIPDLRLAALDHPLLRRLGAEPADPVRILADPATIAEIAQRYEADETADDLSDFGHLICELVALAGRDHPAATLPGALRQVLLTDADGEICPAGELLLPDAELADLLADDVDLPVVGAPWLERHGAAALAALGVRSGFAADTVDLRDADDLPDLDLWRDEVTATGESVAVIRDLDYIDEAAWPRALALIANDPETARALRPTADGPSYTAWWVGRFARFDGLPPRRWRLPGAQDLAGIYDVFPLELPDHVLTAIGVLGSLPDAAADAAELLGRWADPARSMAGWQVPAVTAALVDALAAVDDLDLPDGVRVLSGAVTRAAVVLDHPMFAQVVAPGEAVAGGADPQLAAAVLDLPLASEKFEIHVRADGRTRQHTLGELTGAAAALASLGRADLADTPVGVCERITGERHNIRSTDGATAPHQADIGERHESWPLRWWVEGERLLVDGSPGGVARLIAHVAGCWDDRDRLAALIRADDLDVTEAAVASAVGGGAVARGR